MSYARWFGSLYIVLLIFLATGSIHAAGNHSRITGSDDGDRVSMGDTFPHVSHDEDSTDDWDSNLIFLAIVTIFLAWLSIFIVHALGHFVVLSFYQGKGINIFQIENRPIKEQPYGEMLRAGYLFENIYVLLVAVWLIAGQTMNLGSVGSEYGGGSVVILAAGVVVFHGVFRFLRLKLLGEREKFLDSRKLMIIQQWIDRGCNCGNNTFKLETNLVCESCGTTVERFPGPEKGGYLTLAHLNPFYAFSRKVEHYSYTFSVNAPRREVFNYILFPPTHERKKKFKLDQYQKVDKRNAEARTSTVPVHSKLIDKLEPIFLAYEVSYLGDTILLKYYIREDNNTHSTVMIEQEAGYGISTIQANRHFRKLARVMKMELE